MYVLSLSVWSIIDRPTFPMRTLCHLRSAQARLNCLLTGSSIRCFDEMLCALRILVVPLCMAKVGLHDGGKAHAD